MFGVELVVHIDGSSYLAWVVLGVVTLTVGPLLVVSILWMDGKTLALLYLDNADTLHSRLARNEHEHSRDSRTNVS